MTAGDPAALIEQIEETRNQIPPPPALPRPQPRLPFYLLCYHFLRRILNVAEIFVAQELFLGGYFDQ